MPLEYTPENVVKVFNRLAFRADRKCFAAITRLTAAIERQAKINASNGSHQVGTPTPASPGTGPAVVSGTLRRSITHTPPTPQGRGSYTAKVGMAAGQFPPYSDGEADSATYAAYLETGDTRNGVAYPFLKPAVDFGMKVAGPVIYREEFGRWPRVDY